MKVAICGLLALAATLSIVSSGPLAGYTGQENVFNYKVSVGKESEGSQLHQGFLIDMNVLVRRRSDNTYNLRILDVDVRCHRNNSIPKDKYTDLETNLKVPFEFDPVPEEGLKIYAPETIDSESSNIKRGLVNILEFYDSEGKKFVKISGTKGSTGSCATIENPQINPDSNLVETNKFSNLESNCSSGYQHTVVKFRDVSNTGTFCETEPKISRNIAYNVVKSKDGSADAKLKIKSRERIQLHSLYPQGFFDGVTATTVLELIEVRAQTPDSWTPPASSTMSCTEYNLGRWKSRDTQEQLLEQAKEGFKMLEHCLHKLDSDNHLEDHDVTTVLLQLTKTIRHLNKDSLTTLYDSLEGSTKSSFFQILGLASTADSYKVVTEIFNKALTDGTNAYSVGQDLASYFLRLDSRNAGHMDMKTVKEMVKFWESINTNAQVADRLKNSAILAASALTFEKCIRKANSPAKAETSGHAGHSTAAPVVDPDCPTAERVFGKLNEVDPTLSNDDTTLLKIKLISNMELKAGVPILKSIISDKTKATFLRAAAAWSLSRVSRRNADLVKDFALATFFDRTEDHEVRIAAYLAVARSASSNELTSVVQHVIDNNENEDRQVVSYVISSIAALKKIRGPDGSKCKNFMERARPIYESIVSKVESKLGPRDVFDSAVYHISSHDNRESVLLSVVASKTDIIPRTVYLSMRDPLQSRSFTMNGVTDGVLYNNIAQLKKTYEKQSERVENPDVKAALDAIFEKIKAKTADNVNGANNFSLALSERIDGTEISFERWIKPEAILQRIMASTVSLEKFIRSFHKYNTMMAKTHTESGIKVKFATSQAAVTSVEVPTFSLGKLSRSGVPVSFRYNYKFVSRTVYGTFGYLPESKFQWLSGRVTDKAVQLPRNVTLTFMNKKDGHLNIITVTAKSDPLQGATEKDIYYRSLVPLSGNVESMAEYKKLLKKDPKPLESWSKGHNYLGLGMTVTKTSGYERPSPWKSPLTRWCYRYQEIDDQITPFTFKVAFSKDPTNDATPQISYQINVVEGLKNGQYVRMMGLTVDNPRDAASKSIRFVAGKVVNANEPNLRKILISYENGIKKLYLRTYWDVKMPQNNLKIPQITKGGDWLDKYGDEKIKVTGTGKLSASGRSAFDVDADLNELLLGLGENPDAEAVAEFYRTEEQANQYKDRLNSVDGSSDNFYGKLIDKSNAHPGCSLKTWDFLLKFHGLDGEINLKNPLPDQIRHLYRRLKMLMVKKHYGSMSYDIEDKIEDTKMKVHLNSTVDSERSDLVIQDKTGKQSWIGFHSSFLIPWLRPSGSPIKTFYHNTLNQPVCTLTVGAKPEVETFDRRDVPAEDLSSGCEYLLVSNCKGRKTFAITYKKSDDTYTVLYDNKNKIVVTSTGFVVDGVEQAAKSGLVNKLGDVSLYNYKGILGVQLPNKVALIREVGTSTGYVKSSRIFRGRTCGLCGDFDGDSSNDDVSSVNDFSVSGTCSAA